MPVARISPQYGSSPRLMIDPMMAMVPRKISSQPMEVATTSSVGPGHAKTPMPTKTSTTPSTTDHVRSEPSTGTLNIVSAPRTINKVPTKATRPSTVHSLKTMTPPARILTRPVSRRTHHPLITATIWARVHVLVWSIGLVTIMAFSSSRGSTRLLVCSELVDDRLGEHRVEDGVLRLLDGRVGVVDEVRRVGRRVVGFALRRLEVVLLLLRVDLVAHACDVLIPRATDLGPPGRDLGLAGVQRLAQRLGVLVRRLAGRVHVALEIGASLLVGRSRTVLQFLGPSRQLAELI